MNLPIGPLGFSGGASIVSSPSSTTATAFESDGITTERSNY